MMKKSMKRGISALVAAFAVPGALLVAVPAQADIAPEGGLPETVTADALPTVQINGVVWDQEIVGNTVYVGGQFTMARPAGAAAGVNETARANLLAYNLQTGELIDSWAPSANAQVKSISSNADGSVIYVAGHFTQINGTNRGRVAALDPVTGALKTNVTTAFDSAIYSVHWTPEALYVGGSFTRAGSLTRNRVAAISPSNGQVLPFSPTIADRNVQTITTNPAGDKVVIGGAFTSANGSNNPGYGLVMVDAATGKTNLPLSANGIIRNAGEKSAILSLDADADGFYGVGYVSGKKAGTTEGTFAVDWNGNLQWVEDCHGDSYDIVPSGDVVYVASHKHYCANLGTGGFPQTDPWPYYRATAYTKAATGISQKDIFPDSYLDQAGKPSNTLLNWFPEVNAGTFTGQGQGTWDVDANDDYVVMGGEFTRVNNTAQQGIVRFAKKEIAPRKQGPRTLDKDFVPTVRAVASGVNRITWPAAWDRDNAAITYKVSRDTASNVVYTETQKARFWEARSMGFTDRGLTPGQTVQYRVQAVDSSGNIMNSTWVTVTVSGSGTLSNYANAVLDDKPLKYWRLGETSGRTLNDWGGTDDTQVGTGAVRNQASAINGDSNASTQFKGARSSVAYSTEQIQAPDEFSLEGWFKTSATGKIAGFGDVPTGDSNAHDRTVYIDSNGRLSFGLFPAPGVRTIVQTSNNVRDNNWHHFVATLDKNGMSLYMDGKRVGSRSDVERGQNILGYWKLGGDNTWSGNSFFNGLLDEFAVYPRALTLAEVNEHWVASGRASNLPTAPADAYGASVFNDDPSFFWRLDETSGSVASDASWGGTSGNYTGEMTKGRSGVFGTSKAVSLNQPVAGNWLGIGKKDGGNVVAANAVANPLVFTQEVWVKTTSTSGGRIMGFGGSSNSGLSSSYDRHMQLLDNGRVSFGVNPSSTVTIESTKAVNDGQWHHVVSSLGADGMKLYVDGKLEASNANTGAENYTGYWKIGGDRVWPGSSNNYFVGDWDEAAVYPRVLSLGEIQDHYAAAGGNVPNVPPVAEFSFTAQELAVNFDSTGSGDAEGPITYEWNFGDGFTSTQANPAHTYVSPGTFNVVLKVTDTRGATHTTSKSVAVQRANQAPNASFSHSVSGLDVNFTSTSSDPDGTIVSHAWDFGDGATSTAKNPSHTYTNGAVKTVTLTVTDDRGDSRSTTAQVDPDALPTVDFATNSNGKRAAFTSNAADDGAITSYAWNFGDGSGSVQANPIHDYANFGTYNVTLTVTDNSGNTVAKSHSIVIEPAPNQLPTAQFVFSTSGQDVSFDASGSSDPEGPLANYAWNFGDGTTATGKTATHTYAESGNYTVTLTVTDAAGAVDASTRTVSIVIPVEGQQWVLDDFNRSFTNGWGTADTGGVWTIPGAASSFGVSGDKGRVTVPAGGERKARLTSVKSDEADATFDYTLEKTITGGGNSWLDFVGRQVDASNYYRARVITSTTGSVRLDLVRVAGGSSSTLGSMTVPGLTVAGGETLKVRTQTIGTSPTELKVKVWKAGTAEPEAWNLERTDATGSLQAEGDVGFIFYMSGSVANGPQTFIIDDLAVKTAGVLATNQAPLAEFTSNVTDAQVAVDASGSVDPDGSIVSYEWNFGDGATATGATSTHTYAASGNYTVELKVTDNDGAVDTQSRTISVTVPANPDPEPEPEPEPEPVVNFAADLFDRVVTGGWGSATLGGAWTVSGGAAAAAPFSVADGAGKVSLNAGAGRTVGLNSVSSDNTDLTFDYSISRHTDGSSSTFLDVFTRSISATDNYHARLVVGANGQVRVDLARLVGNSKTTLGATNIAGLVVAPGEKINVRLQTFGTGTTTLRAKVWRASEVEPAGWSIERTDNSSALQNAGSLGMYFYVSASAGPGAQVYTVDNIAAKPVE